ncbi:helix-turn-helix domain-containing protein [Streptomyces drozdowiczii]|uniref:Helix-turn-helix transcriptional regulator n=1 Tax=Streptomyces drozdowiczii TaxID=202862 RepID=A0ABY6PXT9_9ACTN|nr:helix-turn-helix transcriptional regulator [Streptomyces drozdowiczii]MCX0243500.1 helix-turn-helix transcriptional regulator [Streptomyces drozdowiczii]UZK56584.1 helix-turn-helix transcriptional regulator [Streptomyces drozdowiczii]
MITEPAGGGLAGALRGWRTRRRVSQLELATRAGTTQRHLSFIESGRSTPGRSMIIRLAESLEVPIRERNDLLLAAGFAPVYPQTDLDDPRLAPIRTALERILDGHLPYPAVVVDRHGDLVLANAAFRTLTAGVAPHLLRPPVSVPRVLLHPQGLAPRIVNLDAWAWHIVDRVHAESVRNPDDRLRSLAAELTGLAPPRPRDAPHHLGFAVPLRLRPPDPADDRELTLITTLTHFGTATDVTVAELRLEAFLPADRETAALLAGLHRAGSDPSTETGCSGVAAPPPPPGTLDP